MTFFINVLPNSGHGTGKDSGMTMNIANETNGETEKEKAGYILRWKIYVRNF